MEYEIKSQDYSSRDTIIGSTRVARRAGTSIADNDIPANKMERVNKLDLRSIRSAVVRDTAGVLGDRYRFGSPLRYSDNAPRSARLALEFYHLPRENRQARAR
jgi:hypothetical protein